MHHRIHQGKLTEFWMRIYKTHSEARKNPYKKREGDKIEETREGTVPKKLHDLPNKPET